MGRTIFCVMDVCSIPFVLLVFPAVFGDTQEATMAEKMHTESSRVRKERGLKVQQLDPECCKIAQKWAENMAARRSMYHGGGEQIIATGYDTVPAVFRAWLNSSGHRAWVLSGNPRAGWGAAQSSSGQWYWAGAFRRPEGEVIVRPVTTYTPQRRRGFFRRRR